MVANFLVLTSSTRVATSIVTARFFFTIGFAKIAVPLIKIITLAIENFVTKTISQPISEDAFVRIITGRKLAFYAFIGLNDRFTRLTTVFYAECDAHCIPREIAAERIFLTDALFAWAAITSRRIRRCTSRYALFYCFANAKAFQAYRIFGT